MKKIILTVVAAMMMAVSFAETNNQNAVKNVEEAGLTFDLRRLAVTLDLTDNQMDAVKVISENFNDELISASTARRFQRHALIQQAIRKDAKQMRNVLNDKQFNTYMQLLGATLQNRFIHLKGKKDCLPAASGSPVAAVKFSKNSQLSTHNYQLFQKKFLPLHPQTKK